MSGELNNRPEIEAEFARLRARIASLESRINGDSSGFDLNSLTDVETDGLVDPTAAVFDQALLVYRAADEMWIPGTGPAGVTLNILSGTYYDGTPVTIPNSGSPEIVTWPSYAGGAGTDFIPGGLTGAVVEGLYVFNVSLIRVSGTGPFIAEVLDLASGESGVTGSPDQDRVQVSMTARINTGVTVSVAVSQSSAGSMDIIPYVNVGYIGPS